MNHASIQDVIDHYEEEMQLYLYAEKIKAERERYISSAFRRDYAERFERKPKFSVKKGLCVSILSGAFFWMILNAPAIVRRLLQ